MILRLCQKMTLIHFVIGLEPRPAHRMGARISKILMGHVYAAGIICPPDWNRVIGGGVVIFNDANVMTTDDIVTTCQRDRAQPAPGL